MDDTTDIAVTVETDVSTVFLYGRSGRVIAFFEDGAAVGVEIQVSKFLCDAFGVAGLQRLLHFINEEFGKLFPGTMQNDASVARGKFLVRFLTHQSGNLRGLECGVFDFHLHHREQRPPRAFFQPRQSGPGFLQKFVAPDAIELSIFLGAAGRVIGRVRHEAAHCDRLVTALLTMMFCHQTKQNGFQKTAEPTSIGVRTVVFARQKANGKFLKQIIRQVVIPGGSQQIAFDGGPVAIQHLLAGRLRIDRIVTLSRSHHRPHGFDTTDPAELTFVLMGHAGIRWLQEVGHAALRLSRSIRRRMQNGHPIEFLQMSRKRYAAASQRNENSRWHKDCLRHFQTGDLMTHGVDERDFLLAARAVEEKIVSAEDLSQAMAACTRDPDLSLLETLEKTAGLSGKLREQYQQLMETHQDSLAGELAESIDDSFFGKLNSALGSVDNEHLRASIARWEKARGSAPQIADDGQRFEILREHARGGLGEVLLARDRQMNRQVALKRIREKWADHEQARNRFQLEAEITGRLEHPGVVPVYALGHRADGEIYYAMRFIKGDSLEQATAAFHRQNTEPGTTTDRGVDFQSLEFRSLLQRFVDVCNTISYAHSRGVIHRDLKPANIMLGKYGETLVVDWGLAKQVGVEEERLLSAGESRILSDTGSGSAPTQFGSAVGTPQYMSPEQAGGRLDRMGPLTDVFGLGATLYHLLTNQPPQQEDQLERVLDRVEHGEFPRPVEIQPGVPRSLEAICLKALSVRPTARYASPDALRDDIQRWMADESVSVYRDSLATRMIRWIKRNQTLAVATTVAIVLTVIGGVVWSEIQHHREQREAEIERQEQVRLTQLRDGLELTDRIVRQQLDDGRLDLAVSVLQKEIETLASQPTFAEDQTRLQEMADRIRRISEYRVLARRAQEANYLAFDQDEVWATVAGLELLGVWDHPEWWNHLPLQDLRREQQDQLKDDVYRSLALLASTLLKQTATKTLKGAPVPMDWEERQALYLTPDGRPEALATLRVCELASRYRYAECLRWYRGMAAWRMTNARVTVSPQQLKPPRNAADAYELGILTVTRAASPAFPFTGYRRVLDDLMSARETMAIASEMGPQEYWVHLVLAQSQYLTAQAAAEPDRGNTADTFSQLMNFVAGATLPGALVGQQPGPISAWAIVPHVYDALQYAHDKGVIDRDIPLENILTSVSRATADPEAWEKFDTCRQTFGRCISLEPDLPFAYADLSTICLLEYEVLPRSQVLLGPDGNTADIDRRRADLLESCVRYAQEAIERGGHRGFIYWHYGHALLAVDRVSDAMAAYAQAVQLNFRFCPDSLDSLVDMNEIRGTGRMIPRLTALVEAGDERPEVLAALAGGYVSREDFATARRFAARACAAEQVPDYAWTIRGLIALHEEDWATARMCFETAVRLNPTAECPAIGLGAAYQALGDDNNSRLTLERAFSLVRTDHHASDIHLLLAQIQIRSGQDEAAIRAVEQARRLHPAAMMEALRQQARQAGAESVVAAIDANPQIYASSIAAEYDPAQCRDVPVHNGDFERPLTPEWGNTNHMPWRLLGQGETEAVVQTGDQHGGEAALHIRAAQLTDGSRGITQQTITVMEEATYEVSVWMKSTASQAGAVFVAVEREGSEDFTPLVEIPGGTFDWTRFSGTFRAPRPRVRLRGEKFAGLSHQTTPMTLTIVACGDCDLLLDDITITQVVDSPTDAAP